MTLVKLYTELHDISVTARNQERQKGSQMDKVEPAPATLCISKSWLTQERVQSKKQRDTYIGLSLSSPNFLPMLPIHDAPPPIKTPRPGIDEGGGSEPTPFRPPPTLPLVFAACPCPFMFMVACIFPFIFSLLPQPPSTFAVPSSSGSGDGTLELLLNLQL